jgi:hypothetical protein
MHRDLRRELNRRRSRKNSDLQQHPCDQMPHELRPGRRSRVILVRAKARSHKSVTADNTDQIRIKSGFKIRVIRGFFL